MSRIHGKEIQIGNNYVLPIEQSRVTAQQAKVDKIIYETESKANEIVNSATAKADVITQTANVEAQRIIEEARKKAEEEYESIKKKAYDEGFEKGKENGLEFFKKEAEEAIKALETIASASFEGKKNIIDSAAMDIVELVSVIADKVCHASFDTQMLYRMTLDAIRLLDDKEQVTIIVNPTLINSIHSIVGNFRQAVPQIQNIKIIEDHSVSPDGVIVQTQTTRLDSRISAQIAVLAQEMLTGGTDGVE